MKPAAHLQFNQMISDNDLERSIYPSHIPTPPAECVRVSVCKCTYSNSHAHWMPGKQA